VLGRREGRERRWARVGRGAEEGGGRVVDDEAGGMVVEDRAAVGGWAGGVRRLGMRRWGKGEGGRTMRMASRAWRGCG